MGYEPWGGMRDVMFTYDEDIDFSNGDLKVTRGLDYMKRRIYKLLISSPGDWRLYPEEGANPTEFIGEQNTRDAADRLKKFLQSKLQDEVIPAVLSVRIIPVSRESVKCYIELDILGLNTVYVPFTIDYVHGLVYPQIDEEVDTVESSDKIRFNTPESLNTPNKYWDRIRNQ